MNTKPKKKNTKPKKKTDASTKCLQCGGSLRTGARFCGACGTRAGTAETPSAKAAQDNRASGRPSGPVMPPLEPTAPMPTIATPSAFASLPRGAGSVMGIMAGESPRGQPRFATAQRTAERSDRVATVAKWFGAMRQVQIDKNPAGFSGSVREIMDMIAPFTVERDQFQNMMFCGMVAMAQDQTLYPAGDAALALFPERFKPFIADPNRVVSLDVGGPFKEIVESWPYAIFSMTWDVPDDVLGEICVQTIYEGACVLNPVPNGYLEDEQARIEGGLYPRNIKPIVQRGYAKCHAVDPEILGESADQRADTLVRTFAPMAHPKFYRDLQSRAAQMGMGVPIPQERLTDWELQHLHAFAKDQGYNRQEVLSVLINRYESFSSQLSHMTGMFGEVVRMLLFPNHFVLAQCLNMHSRRADPHHHSDYGNFLAQGGPGGMDMAPMVRQGYEEKMPHMVRSLWPPRESLFLLEYRILRQFAAQAAQAAQTTAASAQARPAQGGGGTPLPSPPPPPPGRGPGKFVPSSGEFYYPMLPTIPLTPDGAGVRQWGTSLVLDLFECGLAGDEASSEESTRIKSEIRAIVSANLAAFGLEEKEYHDMDDGTLQQYLLDI